MPLSSAERRTLAARGNRLKAHVIIRAEELSDAAVAHVRQAFGTSELLKVRISTDDRAACDRAALRLGALVPCEIVQRVGRVVLLYRPTDQNRGDDPARGQHDGDAPADDRQG